MMVVKMADLMDPMLVVMSVGMMDILMAAMLAVM